LSATPTLRQIPDVSLLAGSPLHIVLDGSDPTGQPLTYSAASANGVVTTHIPHGNRSLRMTVTGFGTMVYELFEQRVPRVTSRIIQLAQDGFYDGVIFHRVIDQFVIQGGDPTGTGSGGSTLGAFDDQFHVDLQHNRAGILSMAKAGDDTNDSQFFITEGGQRHLDFNHSIFGLLVEGEDVRQEISNVPVDAEYRPLEDVVIESAEVFFDDENAVLMLKAPEGTTGTDLITLTVRNQRGEELQQTFRVEVKPDTTNSAPFLADIPPLTTTVDTEITYQLEAIDVEGNAALYLDQETMTANGLSVPVVAPADLVYSVDFITGLLTVTPTNGLLGEHRISVATGVHTGAVDYQAVQVIITPAAPVEE
jgi:cyclophilin family peptidyl-prolyl cis-trans isomerase